MSRNELDSFIIREARPEDAADLLEYLRQIGSETHNLTFGPEGIPFSVEEERRFLESMQSSQRSKYFLALDGADIVGNANIQSYARERMQHRANIALSVKMSHWEQGIGSALMRQMIGFARSLEVELITLEVLSENKRAIALYKKFGFEQFGVLDRFYKLEGKYYAADYMKLDLNQQ
ncbi:MAG: GNAT family N-acetyltransferase [Eubacteriales bacterium]|nr:GNAT family N-acetyltransferase [Eubacteriales bacterium]MDD3610857.1 GNAT family N-acetyltransferase [Eubacteriales bacterium]